MSNWYVATVMSARMATPDGRILHLDVPGWPGSAAGQHVDVKLTAEDGYTAVRSYSLASIGDSSQIELAVDRLPDGEVSPYLVDVIEPGDQLEVSGPIGGYFVWRPTQAEPVQLVAGGSGVVPLIAMVRAHHQSGSGSWFRLLYSVRAPEYGYYADELAELTGDRLTVDWVYTRTAPAGWPRPPGRLDGATVAASGFAAASSPSVYICGSNSFVEHAAKLLVAMGHSPARIKTERYGGA